MLLIINLLILCIVLFVYIHIYTHIKTSNYLEIYEIENPSKDKFEDLVSMKQPLVINNSTLHNITLDYLITNYPTFEINLYNKTNELFVKIKLEDFYEIIKSNENINSITYNNYEFLEETTIEKQLASCDLSLRPYNMLSKKYDLLMGSINSVTQLKYSINSRNLLYVSQGKVEVTLCPPKDYKYLHVKKNYETLEFYSEINIFDVEPKYYNDFNKVKFLRVQLVPNQVLLIPPYWFYSIKFIELKTIVCYNTYRTYAGSLAIIPELFMQLLQQDNIKFNIANYNINNNTNYNINNNKEEEEEDNKYKSSTNYEIVELSKDLKEIKEIKELKEL
jgi:hypothetical protein